MHDFSNQLLSLALAKAPEQHFIHSVNINNLNRQRMIRQVAQGKNDCTLIILASGNRLGADGLTMIPIPLTKGLLGARVIIYRPDMKEKWQSISSVRQIKSEYIIGTGQFWQSSILLAEEGFNIAQAQNLEALWRMFYARRFDLLHRGIIEAYDEKRALAKRNQRFFIDKKFILRYKSDIFFFVKAGDTERYSILTSQLAQLHASGELQNFIDNYFFNTLKLSPADFNSRQIIQIGTHARVDNPINIDHIADEYWHNDIIDN